MFEKGMSNRKNFKTKEYERKLCVFLLQVAQGKVICYTITDYGILCD